MADAFLGDPYVFQRVYLDDLGAPIAVVAPTIKIFRFDPSTGAEIVLVGSGALSPVLPPDPGRYAYRYVIPNTIPDGTVLYGETKATVPITLEVLVSTETLNLKSHGAPPGLNARFVK